MRKYLAWRPRARGNGERREVRRRVANRLTGAIRQRRDGVAKELPIGHRRIVIGVRLRRRLVLGSDSINAPFASQTQVTNRLKFARCAHVRRRLERRIGLPGTGRYRNSWIFLGFQSVFTLRRGLLWLGRSDILSTTSRYTSFNAGTIGV